MTAVLVTQERMKTLDFCSPVAESVDYYLKRKDDKSIQGIKDLSGKTVGVESGSAMLKLLPQLDDMLKTTGGHLGKIVQYQGYPEAYQDLALGRIDYVVNVWLSLQTIAKEKPDTFEVGQAVSQPTFIAWPVLKGNDGLRDLINEFLLGARKDGTMYALQKKYFEYDLRKYAGGGDGKRVMVLACGTGRLPSACRRGSQHDRGQSARDRDRKSVRPWLGADPMG